MKFLALEIENTSVDWKNIDPAVMKAEARCLYDLQQSDLVRLVYFRTDTKSAVIEFECDSLATVEAAVASFPLVTAGLIHFDIIPLGPYTGFNRLFL